MWHPDPSWQPLSIGRSSAGCWRARNAGRPAVVKRLARPHADDSPLLSKPSYAAYWRREAEVALDPASIAGPGLIAPPVLRVDEDDDGVTVWWAEVDRAPLDDHTVARCLGAFATSGEKPLPWSSRNLLRDRLALAEERGTWSTLERTPWADVAAELWARRAGYLARLEDAPAGRLHGDPAPGNLLAPSGADVVAVDWAAAGWGPIGSDLGYFALSSRWPFEEMLDAFLTGAHEVDADAVARSARTVAVFSVFSRASWALAQVASGEGALGAKLTHPAVAPHIRAVQRQLPQAEALISG